MHERLGEVVDNFHVKCQIWRHASSPCFKAVSASPKLYSIAHKSMCATVPKCWDASLYLGTLQHIGTVCHLGMSGTSSNWSVKDYMKIDQNTIKPFRVKVMWKYKVLSKHECCVLKKTIKNNQHLVCAWYSCDVLHVYLVILTTDRCRPLSAPTFVCVVTQYIHQVMHTKCWEVCPPGDVH